MIEHTQAHSNDNESSSFRDSNTAILESSSSNDKSPFCSLEDAQNVFSLSSSSSSSNSSSSSGGERRLSRDESLLESASTQADAGIAGTELTDLLHNGHYSTIWKTKNPNRIVKAFKHSELYQNSYEIYCKLKSHKSFLEFFHSPPSLQLNLVLEFASAGTLHNYLNQTTFTWPVLFGMIDDLVRGVAFLHNEQPSIVHFSLTDTSILITGESRAKICDFSHAMLFESGGVEPFNGCKAPRPTSNNLLLSRVHNSARHQFCYRAPELFKCDETNMNNSNSDEYSVNSGLITESTAKHTDIYSLALLLWQLASRCSDLYQGIPVPEHRRPYELELGTLPGREQIRVLVSKHRARPLFPDIWKDSNPALKLLKETIAEAWDPEPEARLTALCIAERVCELPFLWSKHRSDMMIACGLAESDFRDHSQKASVASAATTHVRKEIRYIVNEFQKIQPECGHTNKENKSNRVQAVVVGVEKNMNWATVNKVPLFQSPKVTVPLQPHQSRNLCIERNLMKKDAHNMGKEDKLLHQGEKFQYEKRSNNHTVQSQYKTLNTTVVPGVYSRMGGASDSQTQDRNLFAMSSYDTPTEFAADSQPSSHGTAGGGGNHQPSLGFAVAPIQLNVQNCIDDDHNSAAESRNHRTIIKNCNIQRERTCRHLSSSGGGGNLSQKSSSKSLFTLLRSRLMAISTLTMIKSNKISADPGRANNNSNNNNNNNNVTTIDPQQTKLLHFDSMTVSPALIL